MIRPACVKHQRVRACRYTRIVAGPAGTERRSTDLVSALIGAHCKALVNGQPHAVSWNCVSGRAQYTNFGPDMELIEPLGISLHGGHTLAVSWGPGESSYTMKVFRALDYLV